MSEKRNALSLWDRDIVSRALVDSIWKFDPRVQVKNPVMFVVEVTALAVTIIIVQNLLGGNSKFRRLRISDRDLAMVHGRIRKFRRGDG